MLPSFLENLDPNIYYSENYVVLDFETDTSHGDYGSAVHPDNGIVLACWKQGPSGRMKAKWGSEFEMQELVRDIEQADFVVAHNAKYELMWLKRCGLDLSKVCVFDTQIGEYVLLGNLAAGDDNMIPRSISLDMCCRRRGWKIKDPVVDILIKSDVNPVRLPKPWLQGRCEQDTLSTENLFVDQRDLLTTTNRLGVLYTRSLLTPALSDTEFVGMCLDPERVSDTYDEYEAKARELNLSMDTLTGGINWRSPTQVGEFLYDELGFQELRRRNGEPERTKPTKTKPDGQRKTDKNTLEKLKASTPRQKEFLSLRKELGQISSALSKNLEFFKGVTTEAGGIFKAVFNQTVTATHRLSSSGIATLFALFDKPKTVQFQNLPRVFKPLFRARRKGWKLAEADGSQLEFRVAAHLGQCEASKEVIVSGKDIHALTVMVKHNLTLDQLEDMKENDPVKYYKWRTGAKSWTFQPLYGGEGITPLQKRYAKAFREAYPGITEAQKQWAWEVQSDKRLITPWGLRYYWPYAKSRRDGTLNVKNSVYNYPVQALATAEIIPIAVVYFWHRVVSEGLDDKIILVNTVHDSIICEVHPDAIDDFKRISKQAFTTDVYRYLATVYGIDFDFVPLGVGITIGDHWTEGEEEQYNIYFDGKEEIVE